MHEKKGGGRMTKAGMIARLAVVAVLLVLFLAYAVAIYQARHYMKHWDKQDEGREDKCDKD